MAVDSVDRRPSARRPRPVPDPDEDALMSLIMEREERERAIQPSRLQYPSVLPPLRRPESKPLNNSVKNVTLRPTGQKLNAAGDFYSPVRPRESSMSSSTSDFRQNLNISRIKALTPKRSVASPYEQMKTPDRWRTTAMRSNQEEVNASALKRWEEEDARQADRLLEKAARDGDNDALWNDFFYGTKAARAKSNQLPEEPVVYSTSSFPEMFSRSRSNSPDNSCYEARDGRTKPPQRSTVDKHEMMPSDLATTYTSAQTKLPTMHHCDAGSHAANSTAPTSTQTISEMLASMDKSDYVEPVPGDLVAGGDKNFYGSSDGDRERFPRGDVSADGSQCVQDATLPGNEFPRWSVIVVVSCLVVGTSGFFLKELMALMGLFSKRTPFTVSRGEQEHMRDRVSILEQELKGFQLSTSEIEVKSQTVLTELRQHMDRMRIDREKHQDMLATEMQELRRHILQVTKDLVEKERKSIQTHLDKMAKIQVIDEDETDASTSVSGDDAEDKKISDGTMSKPWTSESNAPVEALWSGDTELDRKIDDGQNRGEQLSSEQIREQVVVAEKEKINVQEVVVPVLEEGGNDIDISVAPAPKVKDITKPPRNASGMSWDGILLLVGIMFLAACVVLRVYNINRRKKWFEERRKRMNKRALLLAQRRARAMAASQEDSDEEVKLMTPERDNEDGESKAEQHQPPDTEFDFEDNNQSESASYSPAYRQATTEVSALVHEPIT
ncbi:hypothetical protein PHMEG_00017851 [Phytophthora megakarya]|uniref:Uncharacterized protein n=1 Tax=Phytophthora megakarya TaxID=4795 RepID=A0A225VVS2_9STRA|nr:hypothetical protein PHMEG_00017851 [Phytophthora megakarya]